jgi:hypothetical protein
MSNSRLWLDSLCGLVSDITNTGLEVKNFFIINHTRNIDVDAYNSGGIKPVEAAAKKGSVSSLDYLIFKKQADISADETRPNLLELALTNPRMIRYLTWPELELWKKFNDGTSDFLRAVIAGRISTVMMFLNANPNRIYDANIRYQNAFYWAKQIRNVAMQKFLADYGNQYLLDNIAAENWINVANYYACQGHYLAFSRPENLQIAIEAFDKSISAYQKAFSETDSPVDDAPLKKLYAIALKTWGDLRCKQIKEPTNAAFAVYEKCLTYYSEALVQLKDVYSTAMSPIDQRLIENILKKMAECNHALNTIYYHQGSALLQESQFELAIQTGFEKSVFFAEQAVSIVRAVSQISNQNMPVLEDYNNRLALSYGTIGSLYSSLAETELGKKQLKRSTPQSKQTAVMSVPSTLTTLDFYKTEAARYKEKNETALNANLSENRLLPAAQVIHRTISTSQNTLFSATLQGGTPRKNSCPDDTFGRSKSFNGYT